METWIQMKRPLEKNIQFHNFRGARLDTVRLFDIFLRSIKSHLTDLD